MMALTQGRVVRIEWETMSIEQLHELMQVVLQDWFTECANPRSRQGGASINADPCRRFLAQPSLPPSLVYRPPEAGHRYGIITAIYPRRVFVRFDHQHYSRPVNAAYLAFAHRPAEAVPRSDRRKASCNRSPGLHSEHIKADPSPG